MVAAVILFYREPLITQNFLAKRSVGAIGMAFEEYSMFLISFWILTDLFIILCHLWAFFELLSYIGFWYNGSKLTLNRKEQIEAYYGFAKLYYSESHKEHRECSICLVTFEDQKDKVIALPCDARHYFHVKCI